MENKFFVLPTLLPQPVSVPFCACWCNSSGAADIKNSIAACDMYDKDVYKPLFEIQNEAIFPKGYLPPAELADMTIGCM